MELDAVNFSTSTHPVILGLLAAGVEPQSRGCVEEPIRQAFHSMQ